ncbi:MAG: HAD hydrolase family protein [Vicinamibacterales bacterium]
MIKLLAIDIDGTLLDSEGRVPAANVAALRRVAAAGVRLAVATGRSFPFAQAPAADLPDPLAFIVHNGAIARMRAGDTIARRLLSRALAHEVLAATRPWRPSTVLLFDRPAAGQLVYDQMDWSHPNRSRFRDRNRDLITGVAALEDALDEDPIQVAFNGEVGPMRELLAYLLALPGAGGLSISVTEYPRRDFSLVDVCAAGTTKGTALAHLAATLGIAREEVMAVGDNHNDRDMLAWAGTGVVMGNAEPELLDAGFHQTLTNDEAGLARAIDRFIPGRA